MVFLLEHLEVMTCHSMMPLVRLLWQSRAVGEALYPSLDICSFDIVEECVVMCCSASGDLSRNIVAHVDKDVVDSCHRGFSAEMQLP